MAAKKTIKLMPDYQCSPLWWGAGHEPDMIEPEELPISESLRSELWSWAKEYDSFLDMKDPGNSPPVPPKVEKAFDEKGRRLWKALREELGPEWHVQHWSHGGLLDDPSELPD